jgi:membrane protein implicated in regulation of membrane protease activity
MKHLWMIIAILCLIAAVHRTWLLGIKESYLFFIFAIVAFSMYLLRNYLSKQNKNKQP